MVVLLKTFSTPLKAKPIDGEINDFLTQVGGEMIDLKIVTTSDTLIYFLIYESAPGQGGELYEDDEDDDASEW